MANMKELYTMIEELIEDFYDDDEIALELHIPEKLVRTVREEMNK